MLQPSIRALLSNVAMAALLFGSAGTLAWPEAWAFLAIFDGCGAAIGLWLRRTDPALLAERMKSPFSADQRSSDRAVMGAIVFLFCAWLVLCGLDRRLRWSDLPIWVEIIGAVIVCVAFYGWVGVLRTNSFAAVAVRVQPERGQTVVSTGPYAVVRHPMYGWALLFLAGIPLLLGSAWGLLLIPVAAGLLAARAIGEEEVLRQGLPGYSDYASRVRFRLVPGLW